MIINILGGQVTSRNSNSDNESEENAQEYIGNVRYMTRSIQRDQRNVLLGDHSQLVIPNRRMSNLLSSSDEYISDGSEVSFLYFLI